MSGDSAMHKHFIGVSMVVVVAFVAAITGAGAADAAPTPKPIPNSSPGWLAHGKNLGAANSHTAVTARAYLAPNGGVQALEAAAKAASNSSRFLTPAQYHARFDATPATVADV